MCEEILRKRSQSCEDILEVVNLPLKIAHSEQSSFIDELIHKNYQKLENSKAKIRSELNHINISFDENLEQCSNLVKEEIHLILNAYYPVVNDIQSTNQWQAAFEEQNKVRKKINDAIDEYYLDIKCLAQNQTERLEKILSEYRDEAVKLRLCSPDETNKFLDEVIVELNLKMLSNLHKHEDYKLQILVEGQRLLDDSDHQLKNKATYLAEIRAQELWEKIKVKQNLRLVVDTIFNLTEENLKDREDISQATSRLVSGLSEFAELLKIPLDFEVDELFWKNWIGILNTRLETIEGLCQRVTTLLKASVSSVLETFDSKSNSLTRSIYSNFEILSGSASAINSVANDIKTLKDEKSKERKLILANWHEMINALTKKINESKVFVSDLTLIWTNHIDRRTKLQADLEMELETQTRKWLQEESVMNANIQKQIKAVREAKDLQKLNSSYKSLENALSVLLRKWEKSCESQIGKVETVRQNGIEPMIERKLSEIKEFLLVKYPKTQWFDNTLSLKLKNTESDPDDQIKMFHNYMQFVDNRTLGIYEMLERYLPGCEFAIREESDDWLGVCIRDIIINYETQVEEIKTRHETTLQTVKQTRLAEIHIHADRLLSHSLAVKRALTNLNNQYQEKKLHLKSQIDDFNKKLPQYISSKEDNLNTSTQIKWSILKINRDWMTLRTTLEQNISETINFCSNEINLLNNSNNMFVQIVKDFKHGGNYTTEELKSTKKELNQLKKLIMNNSKTLTNNYDKLVKSISSATFDAFINELTEKHDKFKLEEDLTAFINTIRFRLRTGANNLRAMGDTVEQNIAQIGSMENDNWEETVREIIKTSKNRLDYLILPSELLTVESFSNLNKIVTGKIEAQKNMTNDVLTSIKTVDENTTLPKSYLDESKEYILSQYSDIVKRIQQAFDFDAPKGNKKVKRKQSNTITNQLENKCEDAMSHINQLQTTLVNYYSECNNVCIQELQKHVEQMSRLRIIFNLFVEQQFKNVHKLYILSVNDLEKSYHKNIAEVHALGEINRYKITKKLVLPLAHPNQKHRLNQLLQEAKDACKTEHIKDLLSIYKSRLQSLHDKYVKQISSLRKNYEILQTTVFNIELSPTNLLTIFRTTYDNNYSECGTDSKIDQKSFKMYPLSIWSVIEGVCNKENLTQALSKDTKSDENLMIDSLEFGQVSIIKLAIKNLKESAELIQKLYDEAKFEVIQHEEIKKKWLQMFEYDMNEAKSIYTKV